MPIPEWVKNALKKKKETILERLDKKSLRDLSNTLGKNTNVKTRPAIRKCKKCGGTLVLVTPAKKIGEKYLHECTSCRERDYLRVLTK